MSPAPPLRTGRANYPRQGERGGEVESAVVEPADYICPVCGTGYKTKIGLGVHKRRAHPVQANNDVVPIVAKRRWRDEEVALMAKTEARLTHEQGSCGNMELLDALEGFGRTLEALKGRRRYPEYKAMVQSYLAEYQEAPDIHEEEVQNVQETQETQGSDEIQEVLPVVRLESPPPADEHPAANVHDSGAADALAGLLQRAAAGLAKRDKRQAAGQRHNQTENDHIETARMSGRRRRRAEYARVQELYRRSRKRAAAEIIDGACRRVGHSLEELEAYWRPILEKVSDAPGPTPKALADLRRTVDDGGHTRDYSQLWAPFTPDEIKASRIDLNTAPGPDGISAEEWRSVSVAHKAELFNAWMTKGEIPSELRQCRTIFVPKTDAPAAPGEYRPITIASVPLRHMHALLAKRLLACCPPDMRQRGFITADGTLENTAVLDAILGDCRKNLRECHVAVLDFAKAFDTVSHAALCDLLKARGLPGPFCDYVAGLYGSASTTLVVNGKSSPPVVVGRGVRQGDPLSPILFNMVLDVVLAALPKEVGYRLEGERVSALAYADDLVLLGGSKVGMQESLDCVDRVGSMMGLTLNRPKCSVLSMVPNCHIKKHKYLTENTFKLGGRYLKQVSCVERWRYLGVDFSAAGSERLECLIGAALDNIKKAPLKPQQRLEITRDHLIPRFVHGLVLGKISDDRLRMLDLQIRNSVRAWLRLPKDVPLAYFHASTADGGLGLPSFRAFIPDLIVKRYGRLSSSEWRIAQAASRSDRIRKKLKWGLRQFQRMSAEHPTSHRRSVSQFWREKLHASCDGYELRESSRTPDSTKWIRERCMQYTGRDFVQFVHCHINALPSRVRNSRGRRVGRESELLCRAGCMVQETTAHTIQQCHRTHGGRIERHNCVANFVAKSMESRGWRVQLEPCIRTAVGLRKPDIIAVKGGTGVIVDAQVVSGRIPLDDAHYEKRKKYGNHVELVERVAGLLGLPDKESVRTTSCTISWRGVWSSRSLKDLKTLLGLSNKDCQIIPGLVLRGSHMNWTRWNQMTTTV